MNQKYMKDLQEAESKVWIRALTVIGCIMLAGLILTWAIITRT